MVGKFLEICKENLEKKINFVEISYNVQTELEFIFGAEWFVQINHKEL